MTNIFEDDLTLVQTQLIFEICKFDEVTLFGESLDSMVTHKLKVEYSPQQNFIALTDDKGSIFCLRLSTLMEVIHKIKENDNASKKNLK